MAQKRKTHSEAFKARVALEALKGVRTLSELSAAHGVHPTVIAQWKRQLLEGAPAVFCRGSAGGVRSEEDLTGKEDLKATRAAVSILKSNATECRFSFLEHVLLLVDQARQGHH